MRRPRRGLGNSGAIVIFLDLLSGSGVNSSVEAVVDGGTGLRCNCRLTIVEELAFGEGVARNSCGFVATDRISSML